MMRFEARLDLGGGGAGGQTVASGPTSAPNAAPPLGRAPKPENDPRTRQYTHA